jgi:ATP-dependent exoDNAse (exonuclease V) beta subunit
MPGEWTLQSLPRGTDTGIAIHQIFEDLFSAQKPIWKDPMAMDALVLERLLHSPLKAWTGVIQQMVRHTVAMPFQGKSDGFSLSEIDRFQVEMEFIFSKEPGFIKGFIDLLFYFNGKIYFLDWKTNWLEDYTPASLKKAMQAHDYPLQASLYATAVRRYFQTEFGGAFYVFVRGGSYVLEEC